jgi:hypothetical protein
MSYEIVKGIKIKEGDCQIKYSSNNVRPHYYEWEKWEYGNRILKEQGKEALIISILKAYEEGIFQPGIPNKYSRAILRLRNMDEYKQFDWGTGTIEETEQDKNRKRC